MQIEKVSNNKLKVVINASDLEENNIDINTFMANSLESQELFLDILDLAEEKFNFDVEDSKLMIESISLANHVFIFTITKLIETDKIDVSSYHNVYEFQNFNYFAEISSLVSLIDLPIYTYNHRHYIIIPKEDKRNYLLNEFADLKLQTDYFENFLIEYGTRK